MILSFPYQQDSGERLTIDAAKGLVGAPVRDARRRVIGEVIDVVMDEGGTCQIEMKISEESLQQDMHIDLRACTVEAQGALGKAEYWRRQ